MGGHTQSAIVGGLLRCNRQARYRADDETGEAAEIADAIQGSIHPTLGTAMDMTIELKLPSGAILTLSLSFYNDGPLGSLFRYIGDTGA